MEFNMKVVGMDVMNPSKFELAELDTPTKSYGFFYETALF